jgi:2-succinyl-5-enolpyruvyl-6-hydroxy-3-cyclohexene-1-carboxylate synthase
MSTAATFCATLVDEWIAAGVSAAVVAPGSRSTPMALALAMRPELQVHVVHDERVAGFVALGLGLDGTPAVLLCTSGTAAANFMPAVVEGGLSDVPMLVVTADRPPELRDVGAPQTIDQTHLYGRAVRWFHDPGVATPAAAGSWRSLARRALRSALDGPVHLNLPFREPLVGDPGELPPRLLQVSSATTPGIARADDVPAGLDRQRGVIVVGGRSGTSTADVGAFAERSGWPVLADATSGARELPGAVTAFDAILRHQGFADAHLPEVVVRIGRPPASRVLAEWISRSDALQVQIGGPGVIDPNHRVAAVCSLAAVTEAVITGGSATPWVARWRHAEQQAQDAIDGVLAAHPQLTEPATARTVARAGRGHVDRVVVASSMPIRDLEWFGGPAADAIANRGANGIDGTLSTALGCALAGHRTLALVGDMAFVHDSNALVGLMSRDGVDLRVDLRIVVVDNDGGGIFSFLPQATALSSERFEQLFGTPHGTDIEMLARASGVPSRTVSTVDELALAVREPGPWVVTVPSDRQRNVDVHAELMAAVGRALDSRP